MTSRVLKVLGFAITGGVLLQTTGCDSTGLFNSLASSLIPIALQVLLSGLVT